MKRSMILGAGVVSLLLLGQPAWAGGHGHRDKQDLRAFRKIVRILDVVVSDDHHHRPKGHYVFRHRRYSPGKVCYEDRGFRVCRFTKPARHHRKWREHHAYNRNQHKRYDQICRACR